jgi:diphthine-ammonia ligase
MSKVAISWTGGKDSSLALHETVKSGDVVDCLVTFAPKGEKFLAHPLALMALQAQALELPHCVLEVKEPFEPGYEKAIFSLIEKRGVNTLVTGDIGEIAGHDPDWMVNRCASCGVDLKRPLWHRNRVELLEKLLSLEFTVIFSCVKKPWFTDEWLGQHLSHSLVERLIEISSRTGFDVCGEQGEYHTAVLDSPQFKKRIRIGSYSKHNTDSIMYAVLENIGLEHKDT